ncbi:hypothetical protein KSP39_PZI007172 [Platanthera zijinensis]|uniref:Uncharacterized protein n=1 Tax=Platanthera zijinensis TaxID=2320716 RepID=A0AAP0BRG7_9ASPA
MSLQKLHEGSALAVVPGVSAFQPTTVIHSPHPQLDDTYLEPFLLEDSNNFDKASPKFTVSIHEASTRTIWEFDPGGLNNETKFSLDVVSQQQISESSMFTNEEPFATPIFIFDLGGCVDEEGIEGCGIPE